MAGVANFIPVALGVCGLFVLLIALSLWSNAHARTAIKKWARAQELEIVSAKRRSFVPLWRSGKGYQFFRIVVRDKVGRTRRAWIRCLEFNSAEPWNIEVTWDEPESSKHNQHA